MSVDGFGDETRSVAFAATFAPAVPVLSYVAARGIYRPRVLKRRELLDRLSEDLTILGGEWTQG